MVVRLVPHYIPINLHLSGPPSPLPLEPVGDESERDERCSGSGNDRYEHRNDAKPDQRNQDLYNNVAQGYDSRPLKEYPECHCPSGKRLSKQLRSLRTEAYIQ